MTSQSREQAFAAFPELCNVLADAFQGEHLLSSFRPGALPEPLPGGVREPQL